ncbi:hypothetical protein CBL_08527 [Carabus blaptoides fortunei]
MDNNVYCDTCNSDFSITSGFRNDINRHVASDKHIRALLAAASSTKLNNYFRKGEFGSKEKELAITEAVFAYHAVFITNHFAQWIGNEQEHKNVNVNNEEIQETENNTQEQMKQTIQQGKVGKKLSKRKCASDDDNSKIFKRVLDIMQKDADENDRFGEYVAMELKNLQFESNRRRLTSEIRRAISRIADEDDNNYSSSVSTVPSPYPSPLDYPAQSPSPSSIIYLGSTENTSSDSETDFQHL